MLYLGLFLVIYGVFLLASFLFQFPFLYRLGKVKVMVKMLGKTGFNILLIVFGLAALIVGIIIIP